MPELGSYKGRIIRWDSVSRKVYIADGGYFSTNWKFTGFTANNEKDALIQGQAYIDANYN